MARDESTERTLQGWKEIAAYLERDIRTAVRWEKEAGLPVRRYPTGKRASVYALVSEVDAWKEQDHADASVPAPPLLRRPAVWAAVAASAVAALVIAYGPILNPSDPVAEAADGSMRSEQVWTGKDVDVYMRLSGDGKRVSFVDWTTGDVALKEIATGVVRRITDKGSWEKDSSFAESNVLSPDGSRIAYAWYDNDLTTYQLRIGYVPGQGEKHEGVVVFSPPSDDSGAFLEVFGWVSETEALFAHWAGDSTVRLLIADAESRKARPLKSLGWSYPQGVAISPDGRWIAYGLKPDPSSRQHDILLLASDGSSEAKIIEHTADDRPVAWTPDGAALLFSSRRSGSEALWAVSIGDDGRAGTPQLVSPETFVNRAVGLSPAGELYYVKRTGTTDIFIAEIDPTSGQLTRKPESIIPTYAGANGNPVFSPDGKSLAYQANPGQRRYSDRVIMIRDLETGAERELTPRLPSMREMLWAEDSQSLILRGRDAKARLGLYRLLLAGGEPQLMFRPEGPQATNYGLSRDGRFLHYREKSGPSNAHRLRDLTSGQERALTFPEGDSWLSLSPDGRTFAVVDRLREEDKTLILTADVDSLSERVLLRMPSSMSQRLPTQWTPDGKNILFWRYDQSADTTELTLLPVDGGEPRGLGLFGKDLGRGSFSLHPDGRRVAYSSGSPRHEVWKLSNFLGRLEASDD